MATIVRGFVEPIARELPMECALELICRWSGRSADVRPARGPSMPNHPARDQQDRCCRRGVVAAAATAPEQQPTWAGDR
jgi:hypothetical protein